MICRSPIKVVAMTAIIAILGFLCCDLSGRQASTSITRPRNIPTQQKAGEFPDSWYLTSGRQNRRPAQLKVLEGKPAPKLYVKDWYGKPFDFETMKGKVVVIDFWGTWCPPCVKALPKNVAMAEKYRDDGLVIIGIHDSKNGWNRVPAMARRFGLNYPLGKDDQHKSKKAWHVPFWPTYGVIDRKGILRAVGLDPQYIEKVVIKLLAEDSSETKDPKTKAFEPETDSKDSSPKTSGVPPQTRPENDQVFESMLEGDASRRAATAKLMAAAVPPKISAKSWENSEPLSLENLKGKVVVLDFWATWCPPCIRNIPKINKLQDKYAEDGLVIIGVCHTKGAEKMISVVKGRGIKYPVCADRYGITTSAYNVDGFPDYYLIDRQGKLRIADCKNDNLEEAIKILLSEKTQSSSS